MPRIVIAFFLLTSLLIPPASAQDVLAPPEVYKFGNATPGQPAVPSPEIMKQDVIAPPVTPLQPPSIPVVHLGQHVTDAPNIQMPQLPPLQFPANPAPPQMPQMPVIAPVAKPAMPAEAEQPAAAGADFSELRKADIATGEQVIDPLRVRMKDGRIIQLAGLDIPDLDPYDPGPVALAARNLLKEMVEGRPLRLYVTKMPGSGRTTRMGDILAHLELQKEGVWVQGALLAGGLARVRPTVRNTEMAAQMMKLEEKARKDKKGLWADPRYAVLTAETAARGENAWGIVEGTVFSTSMSRNTVYLQFGPDRRTDFTLALGSEVRRELDKTGIEALSLGGKRLRMRGWLREYDGPYMELENPAWLQVIGEPAAISPAAGDSIPVTPSTLIEPKP